MKPWLDHRVLVTVGTGGVGKTTVAAALGLEAARRGRRALVLTIDPARRLADALAVGGLDHQVREVPREHLGDAAAGGQLFAMMLDTQRTFDELVERLAPDTDVRDRIFANSIYQNLSDALAGSREYSAMEKLHELAGSSSYDLIVLDTPPAEHALDFLDAPRRLTGFLASPLVRSLLAPASFLGQAGLRLFRGGTEWVLRILGRITGLEFLHALSDFVSAFESLVDGFVERAAQTEALLRGTECGFVLVAGPEPRQVRLAQTFAGRLEAEGIRLLGAVANRVREAPEPAPPENADAIEHVVDALAAQLGAAGGRAAAEELVALERRRAQLAQRDARMREALVATLAIDSARVRTVPMLPADMPSREALRRIGARLLAADVN